MHQSTKFQQNRTVDLLMVQQIFPARFLGAPNEQLVLEFEWTKLRQVRAGTSAPLKFLSSDFISISKRGRLKSHRDPKLS